MALVLQSEFLQPLLYLLLPALVLAAHSLVFAYSALPTRAPPVPADVPAGVLMAVGAMRLLLVAEYRAVHMIYLVSHFHVARVYA